MALSWIVGDGWKRLDQDRRVDVSRDAVAWAVEEAGVGTGRTDETRDVGRAEVTGDDPRRRERRGDT